MNETVKEKKKIIKCSLAAYVAFMLFLILLDIISILVCFRFWDANRVLAKTSMLLIGMILLPSYYVINEISGRWWFCLLNDVAALLPLIITLIVLKT